MAIETITVNGVANRLSYNGLEDKPTIPTKTSDLQNDSGFITTAPTKTSDLENDSGYISRVPVATASTLGTVRPDGTTITISNGVISLALNNANGVAY